MRYGLDKSLHELKEEIGIMSGMVEESLDKTIIALRDMDVELAKDVMHHDDEIDNIESKIEKKCLSLFALQQPLAKDLRLISSILKIITDLERIADQAADISELILRLVKNPIIMNPKVYTMADKARGMVVRSIDAFINKDITIATDVCASDDEVDELFNELIMDIVGQIKTGSEYIEQLIDTMFIIKYLERIGDHATNISEWVVYNETGTHRHLQHIDIIPDSDQSK